MEPFGENVSNNIKEKILKEIEEIITGFKNIKTSGYGHLDESKQRLAYSLIVRAKSIITKIAGNESVYFIQMGEIEKNDPSMRVKSLRAIQGSFEAFSNDYKKNLIQLENSDLIPLKYIKIIDDIDFKDTTYQQIINEINGTYNYHFFTSMYILIRKLLENLLYDTLKKYYGTNNIEKFFNKAKKQHHGFGTLRANFNKLIYDENFITNAGKVDPKFLDLLKEFKDSGDLNAHSLFNFPHQSFIENKKEEINILLSKLVSILNKT